MPDCGGLFAPRTREADSPAFDLLRRELRGEAEGRGSEGRRRGAAADLRGGRAGGETIRVCPMVRSKNLILRYP